MERRRQKRGLKKIAAICLAGAEVLLLAACSGGKNEDQGIIISDSGKRMIVNLFGPMEKSNPDARNIARSAFDRTVMMAEDTVMRNSFTMVWQEKTRSA